MKKTLLFLIGCLFVCPFFAQSNAKLALIYAGTSSFSGVNGNPNFGFSLGHQHPFFSRTKFNILMTENLEYKKAGFGYFEGGLGGGTSTSGNINFVNIKADIRARIGHIVFLDLGLYGSYALLNSISNGRAISTRSCFPTGPNQQTICPEPMNTPVTNSFGNIDYGIIIGGGFLYKKITVSLEIQGGLAAVQKYLNRSETTLQQINLSVAFPFSLKKKDTIN